MEDALIGLATEFGLRDPSDGSWQVVLDFEDISGSTPVRVSFGEGFFLVDPLHTIAGTLDDPSPLVETAESAGHPAASGAVHTGVGGVPGGTSAGDQPLGPGGPTPIDDDGCCSAACVHNSIAAGIDAYLADTTLTIEEIEQIAHDTTQTAAACCVPWSWSRPSSIPPTCTPQGGWVHTGHVDQPLMAGAKNRICFYERDVIEQHFRTYTKRCLNCTRITRQQTRTKTGKQKTTSNFQWLPGVDPPPACPPGPTAPGGGCFISEVISCNPWGPPLPDCP